jgi:hypothetical protein
VWGFIVKWIEMTDGEEIRISNRQPAIRKKSNASVKSSLSRKVLTSVARKKYGCDKAAIT